MFGRALNRGPAISSCSAGGADATVTTKVEETGRILIDANGDNVPPPNSAPRPTPMPRPDQEKPGHNAIAPPAQDRVSALSDGWMTALHFAPVTVR